MKKRGKKYFVLLPPQLTHSHIVQISKVSLSTLSTRRCFFVLLKVLMVSLSPHYVGIRHLLLAHTYTHTYVAVAPFEAKHTKMPAHNEMQRNTSDCLTQKINICPIIFRVVFRYAFSNIFSADKSSNNQEEEEDRNGVDR